MIKKRLEAYHRYQRFLQIILIISGCWYMPTKSGKSRYCWPVCVFLGIIVYLIINMNTCYFYRHNLTYTMKNLSVMIAAFNTLLKVRTKRFSFVFHYAGEHDQKNIYYTYEVKDINRLRY